MHRSPPGSSVHGIPDKNTGVGCHFLLQGILPTQGSKPGLLHYRQILYQLSHQESLHVLKDMNEFNKMQKDECNINRLGLFGLPRWHSGKESTCQCRRHKRCGFDPCVRKICWRKEWQPTPVSWSGKFHG